MLLPVKFHRGFTLIELLVLVVIIGILTTLATVAINSSRAKARNAKRVSDIKQMQTALELYFAEEHSYPTTWTIGMPLVSPSAGNTYMAKMPSNPRPWNEGDCSGWNGGQGSDYVYTASEGAQPSDYTINYCLSGATGQISGGIAGANKTTIHNQCSPKCDGKYCGDDNECGGKCTAVSGNADNCKDGVAMCGSLAACSGATPNCLNGSCVACLSDSDCSTCMKCSGGVCVNQTAGQDLKNECSSSAFTCSNFVSGWSSNICQKYSASTASNGKCNGSGSCTNSVSAACGTPLTLATCASAACKKPSPACSAGSLATSSDSVAEVCYTDYAQHGCAAGLGCGPTGNCVTPPPCAANNIGDYCGGGTLICKPNDGNCLDSPNNYVVVSLDYTGGGGNVIDHATAVSRCSSYSYGGYSGWSLPSGGMPNSETCQMMRRSNVCSNMWANCSGRCLSPAPITGIVDGAEYRVDASSCRLYAGNGTFMCVYGGITGYAYYRCIRRF